jgi:hypothetical protein
MPLPKSTHLTPTRRRARSAVGDGAPHAIQPNDEPLRNAPWDEPRRSGLRSTAIANDAES